MVEQTNETGIVYILSNLAMDGYIKIGRTSGDSPSDVQRRMKELDSTGVPRPFHCEYAAVVENPRKVEQALHTAFGESRVREGREFFEGVASHRVKAVLRLQEIADVTPGEDSKGDTGDTGGERPPRKENFKFSMVGIPTGAYLQWTDDPEIQCQVIDQRNRIRYKNQEYSLSGISSRT